MYCEVVMIFTGYRDRMIPDFGSKFDGTQAAARLIQNVPKIYSLFWCVTEFSCSCQSLQLCCKPHMIHFCRISLHENAQFEAVQSKFIIVICNYSKDVLLHLKDRAVGGAITFDLQHFAFLAVRPSGIQL